MTLLDILKADLELFRKRAMLYEYLRDGMTEAADHCAELITDLEMAEVAELPTTMAEPIVGNGIDRLPPYEA